MKIKTVCVLLLCLPLCGCFGGGIVRERNNSIDAQRIKLSNNNGYFRYLYRDETRRNPVYTKSDVLDLWGNPDLVTSKNGIDLWEYKRELAWSGAVVFFVVPVPLVVPVGYRRTVLEFDQAGLVRLNEYEGKVYGVVCILYECRRFPEKQIP